MKKIMIILTAVILAGCAAKNLVPDHRGVQYGMSRDEVIDINKRKGYSIVSYNRDIVVVAGEDEKKDLPSIKSFYFESDRLTMVDERMQR